MNVNSSTGRFMLRAGPRVAAAGLLLFGLLLIFAPERTRGEEPTPASHLQTRLLVLKNGRVVSGRISRNSGGYVLDTPTGGSVVDEELVLFVADDAEDAYRRMRGIIKLDNLESHMQLAGWCLNNGFYNRASDELREVLKKNPGHDEARRMLARLEEITNPEKPRHREEDPVIPKTVDGFVAPEPESLAGLSRESAVQYVSRIQPILLNKCGLAGCHGPSDQNAFQLSRVSVSRNTHRYLTDRNLRTVLSKIDVRQPEKSPLLVEPQKGHGRDGRPVFEGLGGPDQLAELRAWVADVAAQKRKDLREEAAKPSLAGGKTPAAAPAAGTSAPELMLTGGQRDAASPAVKPIPDVLEQTLRDSRKDAFDPNAFNSRYHKSGRNRGGAGAR